MSASSILHAARNAGLSLGLSPAGKIAYRGPADVLELFKPALVENRDAILAALAIEAAPAATPATFPETEPGDARARVERLLDAMGAQNEAARDWWRKSPYDANGNLTIRSIVTGDTATIRLKRKRP
jgi:hypothetical protein